MPWWCWTNSVLCVYVSGCMCVHAGAVAQLYLTLCNPMDYGLPGSSVHGIFQARILEWVPFSPSRGSSQPRDQTHISCSSCIDRRILYHSSTWEVLVLSREREMADLVCLALDLGSDSGVKLFATNEESKVDSPAECRGPSLLVGKGEWSECEELCLIWAWKAVLAAGPMKQDPVEWEWGCLAGLSGVQWPRLQFEGDIRYAAPFPDKTLSACSEPSFCSKSKCGFPRSHYETWQVYQLLSWAAKATWLHSPTHPHTQLGCSPEHISRDKVYLNENQAESSGSLLMTHSILPCPWVHTLLFSWGMQNLSIFQLLVETGGKFLLYPHFYFLIFLALLFCYHLTRLIFSAPTLY